MGVQKYTKKDHVISSFFSGYSMSWFNNILRLIVLSQWTCIETKVIVEVSSKTCEKIPIKKMYFCFVRPCFVNLSNLNSTTSVVEIYGLIPDQSPIPQSMRGLAGGLRQSLSVSMLVSSSLLNKRDVNQKTTTPNLGQTQSSARLNIKNTIFYYTLNYVETYTYLSFSVPKMEARYSAILAGSGLFKTAVTSYAFRLMLSK